MIRLENVVQHYGVRPVLTGIDLEIAQGELVGLLGPNGMGKTTLLLRLSYEIENDAVLNTWLMPVVLKEEAYYGITQLFQLWETIARELESRDTPGAA